ncbi:S-adenosyl-L-methionine-dependent methyltransferase [Annulohypoxylon truncatum]|uniref:S-adenosyl-L-methionine-dependent methyltransferase n=1 Tax=Annulohypoxylon truncatum TaxID=327061 RepID=UPI00200792C8|nr:S-adenosyl-L-methionine-dependent methyltransferase [Annulohypoxylon truncatum]KAI1211886.1 S-adenosyl-L-methionine-dependent methyltransferase [Annulohypoxylon truncatum]
MSSELKDSYVFPRDHVDNIRINLQHYLWVAQFGYLTHPKIPLNGAHLKIADVGTGTGAWLMDLGSRLPESTQLSGLDISSDALPPDEWLPPNMTFRKWNIKDDVPEDLVGQYDIVHVRNFVYVLQDDEIPRVLDSLVKLMKPGGYLQWGEVDPTSYRITKTKPGNRVEELDRLMKLALSSNTRLTPTWVTILGTIFQEGGLEGIECDVREAPPPHINLAVHECSLLIPELLMRATENKELAQRLADTMRQALEQTREGAAWTFTRLTVIGRKSNVV